MKNHKQLSIRLFAIIALVSSQFSTKAQYYFKDIVSLKQTNQNFQLIKKEKITKITIKSYEGKSTENNGTDCWQKISYNPYRMITYTKMPASGESYLLSYFNSDGMLVRTIDSSSMSVTETLYSYNSQNSVTYISSNSRGYGISNKETHEWTYDAAGKPKTMLRILNNADTSFISFVLDEKGNTAEEKTQYKLNQQPTVYYYYDEKNRLTDIVRYNNKAKRLLPDYMFEYDENNLVSVATIVTVGSSDYQKWYYKYDEGLKTVEFCYNKKNELLGKVEYEYEK